jgi:hypothetical protein
MMMPTVFGYEVWFDAFWDVTLRHLASSFRRFEGTMIFPALPVTSTHPCLDGDLLHT